MQKLYVIGQVISQVMLIHVMWLLLTVLGLGLFGIFPATLAAATAVTQMMKQQNVSVFKFMWQNYRVNFIKKNTIFLIWLTLMFLLYFDFIISKQFIQSALIHYLLILISIFVLSVFLLSITIFTRYDFTIKQHFKQSFLVALVQPFETFSILISAVLTYFIFATAPILTVFFGLIFALFPLIFFGERACLLSEEKKTRLHTS